MDDMDLQLLIEQPLWRQVLDIYTDLIIQAGQDRSEEDQGTRWTRRIAELDLIESEELSAIHGQLIALGWLTFQLEDRNAGLMYRITTAGKKACEQAKKAACEADQSAAA